MKVKKKNRILLIYILGYLFVLIMKIWHILDFSFFEIWQIFSPFFFMKNPLFRLKSYFSGSIFL
jgi:hypothetical protein